MFLGDGDMAAGRRDGVLVAAPGEVPAPSFPSSLDLFLSSTVSTVIGGSWWGGGTNVSSREVMILPV